MRIDNFVLREIPQAKYPAPWRVVDLREPIRGLFRNDTVEYLMIRWRVYDISNGGRVLVLRPE